MILVYLSFVLYLFISTSYFAYDWFNSIFVVTIYWGLIAGILIFIGILKNKRIYRTLGLYFLVLTIFKILSYDIWTNLEDSISKIIALLFVWSIMITLNLLYSKKYWKDIKKEFGFTTLKTLFKK